MTHHKLLFALCIAAVLSGVVLGREVGAAPQPVSDQAHNAWVAESLSQMRTITPGKTRKQLLEVFEEEGGLSTALRRTYVYRRCRLFKVDVEFEPVGRSARDSDGRVTRIESTADIIKSISRPYVAPPIFD